MNRKALIIALLRAFNRPLNITSIQKLCYLADYIHNQEYGEAITDYTYVRWNFGPYTRDIYDDLFSLDREKIVSSEYHLSDADTESKIFTLIDNTNKYALPNGTPGEIVALLARELSGYGARGLTEIAYMTNPMKKLKATLGGSENFGVPLDLSL